MRKTTFLLVLCMLFSFGHAQSNRIVIPMDVSTQRPIIEVTVNGQGPYKFIFDTGSGTNVIDTKLAEELGLKVVGEDPLRSQGAAKLVSKRHEAREIAIVGSEISKSGTLNAVNLRAMLPVDGIIGNNFAADYLVTLDYPGSQLILERKELNKAEEGVVAFLQKPRVINLNIMVDGRDVETHLDTGNPGGFSLPHSLKDELKFKEPLTEGGEVRTPVASYKPWHGQLVGDIQVGNVIFKNPDVILVEGFETANIGYSVVKDLRTVIDIKNRLIKFEKAEKQDAQIAAGDGKGNEFTGWYGGKVREVFLENGELFVRRNEFTLKLEPIEGDLYKMTYHMPVNNELPNVRFDRDTSGKVTGLTFIYKDGREDKVKKD